AGAMIIACHPNKAPDIIRNLQTEKIECSVVGEIKPKEFGKKLLQGDSTIDMPYFDTDPYWNAFFKAWQSGWK
ncbi:MAG: AIR synthase, partial [Raineya sp.]|nr:AIR synthase [Raineya sp.]